MKWVVLGLLWVAYFLLQAMRQVYNASLPQIRADFAAAGATAVSLGLVGTVFYFVYGLCAPCASVVADVFRRKAVIVAGCLLFSVGVFASGCAGTLAMIVLSYGVVNALGQSMVPASSSAVISEWHEKTRATALSIYQVANYAGIILAALLAGGVGARGAGAWRWAFWILGGFGLVWAGVLAACLRTQPAAEAGRREAPRPAAARAEKPSVRAALPCRRAGALLLRRGRPRLVRAHRPRLARGARLDGRRDALARLVLPRGRTDDPRRPPPVHAPPDAR